jgi:RNA polymerase sigma factor (sigma-70 family)
VVDTKALLAAAAAGDQAAWDALVQRYSSLVWSIARSFRLDPPEAADVVQMTWLRLVENVDRIVDPERLPGWLATTARRECLLLVRRAAREHRAPGDGDLAQLVDPAPPIDEAMLRGERDAVLWQALARLGERCQQLLRVLMASPPPAYREVAVALGMPVGSIGPTRQRCLAQLRQLVAGDALLDPREPQRERS